jgi:hypothetical protein
MHPENSRTDEPAPDVELEGRLADAHAAVLAREAERKRVLRELPPPKPRAQRGWVAMASAAWLLVALALISPPAFLSGPTARPSQPEPALVEPSLRYGVWLAQHRVASFARREGRLPSFLAEAGIQDSSLALEVTGETTYRIRARAGDVVVEFASGMAIDSFLGQSVARLRGEP